MRFALTVLLFLAAGCPRDPVSDVCPDIAKGELVITEVAGQQSGGNLKPWIEVYNASGSDLNMRGVRVRFRRGTGAEVGSFIVRGDLPVEADGYTTLGLEPDPAPAAYIDYGFAADFHTAFPTAAAVDLYACGGSAADSVDQMRYESLPSVGTYSLGASPPTADLNDLPAMWCTDSTLNPGSVPGTPQRANTACP